MRQKVTKAGSIISSMLLEPDKGYPASTRGRHQSFSAFEQDVVIECENRRKVVCKVHGCGEAKDPRC